MQSFSPVNMVNGFMARVSVAHIYLELSRHLSIYWCSATLYLLCCSRQTGYSAMVIFFCLQSRFSFFFFFGLTFLWPLHILWLRCLFSHLWTCVALSVMLSPNIINTAIVYQALTMCYVWSLMYIIQTTQLFLLPLHNALSVPYEVSFRPSTVPGT